MTTTKKHTTRDGWWEFVPTLSDGIEFKTSGALRGERGSGTAGELSPARFFSAGSAIYTVYSYKTPIAWRLPDNEAGKQVWVMPDTKYSVTTSRHQNKIRVALSDFADVRER